MSWPLSQDYNEAIQSPAANFSDADLKKGEAVCNSLGLPMPYSGNFADVYQVRCPGGSRWAVKCFTREVSGLRERYQEISAWLGKAKLPFSVEFSYLEQGIRVHGKWYPILKMQWVEGLTLNQFVGQHLDKPAMLEALLQLWAKMGKFLRAAKIGHCDLQHGNVLLVPGSTPNALALKLIDYDGMWIPPLAGKKTGEVGHANYQHPRRLREGTYSLEVDRFPLLLVATAMRALKADKALWAKYDNGDNLLFKESDLADPPRSALFQELASLPDPGLVMLAAQVRAALKGRLESTALLEEAMPEVKAPKSAAGVARAAAPVAAIVTAPPKVEKTFAFDDAGPPSTRIKRKPAPKKGLPAGVLAAVAGAIVLVGGAVAAFYAMSGASPKKTETPLALNHPIETAQDIPPDEKEDAPPKISPAEPAHETGSAKHPGADSAATAVIDPDPNGPIGEIRQFAGSGDLIRRLAVSPDGKQLLTAGFDDTIRLWDVVTGRQVLFWKGPVGPRMHGVAFLPDGKRALFCSIQDKTLHLWDLVQNREIRAYSGHTEGIWNLAIAGDGQVAASAGQDSTVSLWDVENGKELHRLEGNKDGVESLGFSSDGKLLLVGSRNGPIRLWNVEIGKEIRRFEGHSGSVNGVVFSRDGKLAYSGGSDKIIRVWQVDNGREVRRMESAPSPIWSLVMSADGARLLTANEDGTARLWDSETGKELCRFEAGRQVTWAVAFTPDGKDAFSSGNVEKVVRMWRLPPDNYVPPLSKEPAPPVVTKPETKPAAPDEAGLVAADKEIKDLHKDEFAKKKPAELQALAAKLLQEGIDTKDKPADCFALLREAGNLAARIGDFPLALRAADETAKRFDVDVQEIKRKILEAGSRAASTPLANARVVEAALPLAEEGVDADDFDWADRFMKIARAASREANVAVVVNWVQVRAAEIERLRKAYEPVKAALQTLAGKPDDADANLVLGTYLALSKGDWNRGLPALAKGSDPKLKALAAADVDFPLAPEAQVELANKYLTQAEGESGAAKAHLQRRACYWYQKAKADLTGLSHAEAVKKIAEIEKTLPHAQPAIVRAYYGTNNDWQETTARVWALLFLSKGQKLSLKAEAGELGVPNHGNHQGKTLVIVYRVEGQTCLSITPEGGTAVIPGPPGGQDAEGTLVATGQELLVLAARYGAEGKWVDGTAEVQQLVKGDALSGVKGDGFGLGDPVPEKGKALLVVYRYGNRTRFRAIGGNKAVELGDAARP